MNVAAKTTPIGWLICTSLLLALAEPAAGMTMVLQPGPEDGKDISLYERTDIELSSSKSLYAIHTGPPGPGRDDFTSLIEFDVASVPTGGVVSATLWLYENNAPTFSFQHVSSKFPNTIMVQPPATAWEEDSVFYSTLPDPAPGYEALQTVDAVDQWFSWDVTNVVSDWLSGDLDNNGFMVTSLAEVRDDLIVVGAAFDASEQPNAPFLEIEVDDFEGGDFDEDGDVDGNDLLIWQRGETAAPQSSADLALWEINYGLRAPDVAAISISAVPEPTAASLLLAVALPLGVKTRNRRLKKTFAAAIWRPARPDNSPSTTLRIFPTFS